MNKTITMYELLGLVKDDKAPKKVKYRTEVLYYDEKLKEYFNDEDMHPLFAGVNTILDEEVEILEEKKIPEKLGKYADISGDLACEWTFGEKRLKDKINEIIDCLEYLNSKGDE